MRSGVSQGPWTVKIADIFQVSGGWRTVDRIEVASLYALTAVPWAGPWLGMQDGPLSMPAVMTARGSASTETRTGWRLDQRRISYARFEQEETHLPVGVVLTASLYFLANIEDSTYV